MRLYEIHSNHIQDGLPEYILYKTKYYRLGEAQKSTYHKLKYLLVTKWYFDAQRCAIVYEVEP